MKILISPAKSMDFDSPHIIKTVQPPQFLDETFSIVRKMKRLSKKKLMELMSISENLARQNVERYQEFSPEFNEANSKAAIHAFKGDVYLGMEAQAFSAKDLEFADRSIRILSGLYGMLKPKQFIQPYRLEMGTRISIGRNPNLVRFWKKKLTDALNKELEMDGEDVVINLASKEYAAAIDFNKVQARVIHCEFKEYVGEQLKFISFNAKKARGMMCRYIVKNKIYHAELVKQFDYDGYRYDADLSSHNHWLFVR